MSKITLEEKKLKALKQQLFGKDNSIVFKNSSVKEYKSSNTSSLGVINLNSREDTFYKNDLLKVFIFTALVLSIQFILFFGLRNNLLRISFLN